MSDQESTSDEKIPTPIQRTLPSQFLLHVFVAVTALIVALYVTYPLYAKEVIHPKFKLEHSFTVPQHFIPSNPPFRELWEQSCPQRLLDMIIGQLDRDIPTTRYDLRTNMLACWPSDGGMYTIRATPALLSPLEIGRFGSTSKSLDPFQEDAFCKKLRQLGAARWADYSPCTEPNMDCCSEDLEGCTVEI